MLDVADERLARDRFERCVEALFRLVDDAAARTTVRRWVRDPPEAFTAITETPKETAGHFVRQLADIGTIRPTLGPLYGTPKTWRVLLPESCTPAARLQWSITRDSFTGIGEPTRPHGQNSSTPTDSSTHGKTIQQQAMVLNHLDIIARKQSELALLKPFAANIQ